MSSLSSVPYEPSSSELQSMTTVQDASDDIAPATVSFASTQRSVEYNTEAPSKTPPLVVQPTIVNTKVVNETSFSAPLQTSASFYMDNETKKYQIDNEIALKAYQIDMEMRLKAGLSIQDMNFKMWMASHNAHIDGMKTGIGAAMKNGELKDVQLGGEPG